MPPARSDAELSEKLADFLLLTKITNIRDQLDKHANYSPSSTDLPQLCSFEIMSEEDVKRTITSIVNLSISPESFAHFWKSAIVRPLLKKQGLDLVTKNYWPVSDLPFLSKLVEKCILK